MNKKSIGRLTDAERGQLPEVTRKGHAAADKLRHAQSLWKAEANGPAWPDERIAERFAVSVNTVPGSRQRLVEPGLEAALNRKKQARPSRPPRFDGEGEARLMALRCREPPAGHARGTLRLLADQAVAVEIVEAIRHETVRQGLKNMG
jgi:Homeodomain-like domain